MPSFAQAPEAVDVERTLIVGTKVTEPFVLRRPDGSWEGISIELWENIARELGWTYEYRQYELTDVIEATQSGAVDVAVAAFTVTSEREEMLDFSHPFYTTGLGLAVAAPRNRGWLASVRGLFSRQFLTAIGALAVLLLVVGSVMWLLERRRNAAEFGGSPVTGIGSGFWWSAVTMTTVGYGDKSPRTAGGRLVGLIWMFASIVMISTFTAAITSSLTLTQLQSSVQGPDDLPNVRVGTLADSAPADALRNLNVSFQSYPRLADALDGLVEDRLDVVVHDAPILLYRVKKSYQGEIDVLPRTFEPQVYALMLPPGSALREPINRTLLRELRSDAWHAVLERYLGE